ncbi:MAG: hypothetical protein MI924_17400, partial [Chloroflexales bacterium]|nr:hypothetical protein [Chloroflexales bacterium]
MPHAAWRGSKQAGNGRAPGCGAGLCPNPGHSPDDSDGHGNQDVMQLRLCTPTSARSAPATGAH